MLHQQSSYGTSMAQAWYNTVQARYKHGTRMVQHSTSMVQARYKHGTSMVQARYKHGTSMVQARYNTVQAWYKHGTSMVQARYNTVHKGCRFGSARPPLSVAARYAPVALRASCAYAPRLRYARVSVACSMARRRLHYKYRRNRATSTMQRAWRYGALVLQLGQPRAWCGDSEESVSAQVLRLAKQCRRVAEEQRRHGHVRKSDADAAAAQRCARAAGGGRGRGCPRNNTTDTMRHARRNV